MADLILLPTLERLYPHDIAEMTPKLAFGLTFSVALGNGNTPATFPMARSFLMPWDWGVDAAKGFRPIQHVHLYSLDGTVSSDPIPVELEVTPQPGFRAALSRRFSELETSGFAVWGWTEATDRTTAVSHEKRSWPAFVGQASLYPYPLPQSIGLSCRLAVPEAQVPVGDYAVVAPILRLRHEDWDFSLKPVFQKEVDKQVTLAYEVAEAVAVSPPAPDLPPPQPPASLPFSILVETMACSLKKPSSTRYFNFTDLWVRMESRDIANAEWRAGLEARLAEQLHLGRILVDWMSRELQKEPRKPLPEYPEIASIVLEQVVSTFGPGVRQGPEGSFLDRARFFREEVVPEVAADVLRTKAQEWLERVERVEKRRQIGWLRQAVTGTALEEKPTGSGLLDLAVRGESREERILYLGGLSLEQTVAELDQMLASLSNPATLRELFRIQWKAFVDENPNFSGDASKLARSLVNGLPPEVDLQSLLLLDHLGDYWGKFKLAVADRAILAQTYKEKVLEALRIPGTLHADLADRFLARVLPNSDEEIRNLDPGRTKGLTFQLDTLEVDPGQADMLAHLQGLGVLMQRKGDPKWSCLNMAVADLVGGNSPQVLLPTRLAYLNDLRSPTVTYDNGPLTAESPMSPCAIAGVRLADGSRMTPCEGPPQDLDASLVDFKYARDAKIPGLIFGETYRILPFMVTNSGAIPQALSDGNPWKLKADIKNQDLPKDVTPREAVYLREMHVGSLRVQPKGSVALPPIPDNVAPCVRELSPKEVLPPGDPLFGDPTQPVDTLRQTDSLLANTPLLLLAKGFPARSGIMVNEAFRFEVRPPAVDLQTWDRWVAKDARKDRRKFVWRSFYQLAFDKGQGTRKLENAGVYLDDPAVDGIFVELAELGLANPASWQSEKIGFQKKRDTSSRPVADDFSNWDKADCTLVKEQYEAITIGCEVKDDGFVVTAGSASKTFPKTSGARMYRLTIYASLAENAEKRFLETKTRKEIVRREGKIVGTSPWHLLIEIPQELPADPASLETALLSALTPDAEKAKAGKLAVKLDFNDGNLNSLKGLIYRAEIWHQVWHWRGRPPVEGSDLFPKGAPGGELEMSEFGPRSDDEHRRLPMPRQVVANKSEPVFLYEEDLDRQGPLGDRRALAHRFSARVFSRWEGILPEERSYLEAIDSSTRVRWKPHFVPCRHQGVVPAPKVRIVLPLTEGVSESVEDGPGLLVVVDGAWYEVGGLAERLGIQVMTVSDPTVKEHEPAPSGKQYFQIGTDPIFTTRSAGEALGSGLQALSLDRFSVAFRVDGAIGHHRDHSQTDPHFLASSFLLSRPMLSLDGKPKPVDLSWWFLKLRFRRELTVEGQEQPLASEWSAPFWVQVLPGVERVEEDWFGSVGKLTVSLSGQTLTVQPFVSAKATARPNLHLFAVMTRKVIDFAGRPDQEAYLGLWSWNPAGTWRPAEGLDIGTEKDDLYVRFIEVQSRTAPKANELWDRIFKADQPDSGRARIVRISKRFKVNGGAQ